MPDFENRSDRASSRDAASIAVAEGLSIAIHEHRLAPGTRLGEDEIGEIYGVSRTVVRAALQDLAHGGLVEIARHRGAQVAQPGPRAAEEVFEARSLLEPHVAAAAAIRASAQDLDLLRRHVAEEETALAQADHGRALRLSGLFHVDIARIAEQGTIAAIIEMLVARSSLIIALYRRSGSAPCACGAHHALIDALAEGDSTAAEQRMRTHLADLHAGLDLRARPGSARNLRAALQTHD